MAQRTTTRRRGGRSSSSSGSNQMPLVLGGAGVVVVVLILVLANRGGGKDEGGGSQGTPANQPAAAAPHLPETALTPGAAKAGKAPAKPAPELTMATLERVRGILQEAKVLNNEGVRLRDAGKNQEARDAQSAAKDKIDQLKTLIDKPLTWQEEAEFEGWAQPAVYATLADLYGEISKVEKRVRMSGGTR